MSKKINFLMLITLIAALMAGCSGVKGAALPLVEAAPATTTEVVDPAASRTITVVGEGKVSLEPDLARINVGAEARSETVSEARAEVESIMDQIFAALKEMDISEKDIQTSHYVIHFEREPLPLGAPGSEQGFRQNYYVSNMVRVTIRDVEAAGDVLDAVVQAGANQLHGVTYTVSDRNMWQSEARAQAVADARSRADELAELANVQLGPILSVSEIIGGLPMTVIGYESGMGGGGVSPGEMGLRTQIEVTFTQQPEEKEDL